MMVHRYFEIGRRFASSAFALAGLSKNGYLKGANPVLLTELVSPLRYDILIREKYFAFFRSHIEIYHSDFPRYLELARELHYFVWFRDVVCFRFKPHLLTNKVEFDKAFAQRLHRSARLFASFEERGLDPTGPITWHPITLHSAKRVLPSDSGKIVRREFYAGDGCHRLALLLLSGCRVLEPTSYLVNLHDEFSPLDNTSILLHNLRINEPEYTAFLSLGYTDRKFTDLKSLQRHIQENRPGATEELNRVVELDVPNLAAR